ncbi:Flp pilus assembly protein CpaB [Paraburkholderia caballeronis]|uniref:Pilus assembly protein CpaB n=1 Tax=Paraburkholderia caballeronis TaxID=416943 RepID=A0A1H7RRQ0_9BURK|nr:Flp pilus assembly protein CpaB [Paraburkholderia caballeronis]PXW23179.1 pilus assembly protein CpaB [Paraburkholderia caballeronis]PXW97843.1 pilus assembly protein CpaB [Paraburkholderia caballeronis]RAJ94813.1 pilus assembly protein CpaB [Paraburkholderia caballeronis]TDV11676.1 pilus assembly protein CpaB [Paraburkholderia caballeronis]TDV14757.1 pilus assembly protein CpaB [Paraburkholderia caballeronis]
MSKFIKLAVLLIGALVVALIVRIVVQSATAPRKVVVTVKRVRVSTADLPAGLLLRDADLVWKDMPAANVPSKAVVEGASDSVELKGSLLRNAVAAGQPVLSDEVILPDAPGFLAATLQPGLRAVSVAIDDVSGNAGLIEPGDYVDLLLTQQLSSRTESPDMSVSSETVVQHVRVLAVGSEIQRPKDGGSATAGFNRARTVTLEVTPHMAEVVSVAARLGSLSLALRSFALQSRDDADTVDGASATAPVWAGDISRAVRELPRARGEARGGSSAPPVTIYRGSEKSTAEQTTMLAGDASAGQPPPLPPQLPAR